jgi:hypothetical protein
MDDLIARLEAATEGGAVNDVYIELAIHGRATRDPPVPHYTTSLDAALPDEKIIKTEIDAQGWHATALAVDGRSVYGFGRTEALARRIAALKARS